MKILLIDQARKNFREQDTGRWHFLPYYFEKFGHEVYHVTRKDWKKFPFIYLKFKPDIVISVGPVAGYISCILRKLGIIRAPLVHDWNDYWTEILGPKHGLARIARLEHYAIENSDFVTTPSRYLAEKCRIYGKSCQLFLHGVELNLNLKPANLRGFSLLYIGEQTPYKKIERIIEAVKGLKCDLYLIGHANEELKRIAGKNVHFLGKVSHKEIGAYIKAANVCVITADQENLKMYEFARAGKVVLAYKGRISYFLTHLQTAYITENLKEGVIELMKSTQLRRRLEKNIKNLPTYSWKEITRKYLNFLKGVKRSER
ncbi:MAG: glycosyltransferase family 4 protein [Nanoarchaeota archaeon]